jgi:hypothetical protein
MNVCDTLKRMATYHLLFLNIFCKIRQYNEIKATIHVTVIAPCSLVGGK